MLLHLLELLNSRAGLVLASTSPRRREILQQAVCSCAVCCLH